MQRRDILLSKKTLLASLICGLAMLVAQPKSLFAASPTSLAGSWHLLFQPINPPAAANIPGLATFTSDGWTIETDGAETAPGSVSGGTVTTYGTPGHGTWQLLPSQTGFYIRFESLNINADGSLSSRRVTVANVTVTTDSNGNPAMAGQYTTTVTTPDGGGSVTQPGKVSGSLIPMPALP